MGRVRVEDDAGDVIHERLTSEGWRHEVWCVF